MKPSSALILEQDGIILLHRKNSGWFVVGHADPTGDDLDGAMAFLRSTARELTGGKFATKLVIPNSQLLYKKVEIGDIAPETRAAAVRQALEGLTPYPVDELAFDWRDLEDGWVQAAIVAEKTLAEAEEFALQHKFNPVCFVAIPTPDTFEGEPYFGETSTAHKLVRPGGKVEREDQPIDLDAVLRSLHTAETADQSLAEQIPAAADETTESARDEAEAETEASNESASTGETEPEAPKPAIAPFVSARSAPESPDALDLKWVSPRLSNTDAEQKTAAQLNAPPTEAPEFSSRNRIQPVVAGQSNVAKELDLAPVSAPAEMPEARTPPSLRPANRTAIPPTSELTAPPRQVGAEAPRNRISPVWIMLLLGAVAAALLTLAVNFLVSGSDRNEALLEPTDTEAPLEIAEPLAPEPQPAVDVFDAEAEADAELIVEETVAPADLPEPEEAVAAIPDPLEEAPVVATESTGEVQQAEIEPAPQFQRIETAPEGPVFPSTDRIDTLYIASIDRMVISHDAVALPSADLGLADEGLRQQTNPPGPDVEFVLDDRGLVVPDANGAVTPEGVLIFAGTPAIRPLARPGSNLIIAPATLSPERMAELAAFRPIARPGGLVETNERARLSGLSRTELAGKRPIARPDSIAPLPDTTPTEAAVVASLRPMARPNGMQRAVQQALQEAQATASAPAPAAAPPRVPSGASVTQAATINGGVRLNTVSLMGIYGQSSDRRALVRLPSGRFVMVEVGDRLDGGRVTAISGTALSYSKGGRSIKLDMPRG